MGWKVPSYLSRRQHVKKSLTGSTQAPTAWSTISLKPWPRAWMIQLGMHNTGLQTPYAMMKHYQKYETVSISHLLTQDVLAMAGAEDQYIPVHQLPDQIATLAHVRSLTARLFTRAEQAQNHVQVGNFGLAFRVMID
jgi:hypothetical protein